MGFVTALQDVMNPHTLFTIKVPSGDVDDVRRLAEGIMKRWHVVTWGWQESPNTVKFRVNEPDRFTALGRLEEAGFKREKEKEPNSPFLPPGR
jgi:hypothetical protein